MSEAYLRQELLENSEDPMQIYESLSEYMLEKPQENKSLKKTKDFELVYGKVTKIGYKYNYSDNIMIFVVTFLGSWWQ